MFLFLFQSYDLGCFNDRPWISVYVLGLSFQYLLTFCSLGLVKVYFFIIAIFVWMISAFCCAMCSVLVAVCSCGKKRIIRRVDYFDEQIRVMGIAEI